MKKNIPGLALTVIIALSAKLISHYFNALGTVSLAIILGAVIGNIKNLDKKYNQGINFSEKKLLTTAIVLMGFNLKLYELNYMGAKIFAIIIPLMAITICSGILIGRLAGFSPSLSILLGTGNAVCGSSAIAAVAPVTQADEEEIGISISIVNLLGTIGMLLLPILCRQLDFSDIQSSYLLGGSLQAIGQVAAAGFSLNDHIGETATIIKMLRVIMIGPVVIITAMLSKNKVGKGRKTNYLPRYILGFFLCSIIASIFHTDTTIIPYLQKTASFLLIIAMAGIGLKIKVKDLLQQGSRALAAGTVIAIIQITVVLTAILLLI